MFIYNFKINGSKIFKYFLFGIIILIIIIFCLITLKLFKGASNENKTNNSTCLSSDNILTINANNYTSILKIVHENTDKYVGLKINFTGFIYRVSDLSDKQFILARNMIISSDYQSVVVGFLCEYENANNFENNTWVEVTGEITKGDYHGDMPIIKITEIKKVDKPNEEFVYPPDESYIPTCDML